MTETMNLPKLQTQLAWKLFPDNTIPAEEPTGPNETVPTVPCEPTINYPQISGFSNTSTGTKISWNSYSVQLSTEYMFLTESHGAVWASVQPLTLRITH